MGGPERQAGGLGGRRASLGGKRAGWGGRRARWAAGGRVGASTLCEAGAGGVVA